MILQSSAPVQNPYKDRHRHAVPRLCLCFSAGRVQGPSQTRSYSTYFAYFAYSYLFVHLSLARSVSIYNCLYVIPVSSILGRLPLVPVGATGTIPFAMRRETADFPGAFCDKSANGGDGCRWWYVNSWALGWGTKQ